MLRSAKKATDGLGQQAHLPPICINRRYECRIHLDRKQCVPRAAEQRLESLLAATAVALLVEASLPSKLSYLCLAPKLANGAEVGATRVSMKLPLEYVSAPAIFLEPELSDAPGGCDRFIAASSGTDSSGLINLYLKNQAVSGAMATPYQMQIPQPLMVVSAVAEEGWRAGPPGRDLEPATRSQADGSGGSGRGSLAAADGGGGGSSPPSGVVESASLIVGGGLAGVAGVYFFASRGTRAAGDDASGSAPRTSGPASSGAAATQTAARAAVPTSEGRIEAPVQRGPYGAFDGISEERSYDGPPPRPGSASRRWNATQRQPAPSGASPAAAGSSPKPRPGPSPPQGGGRGPWPAASSPGVNAAPNAASPPYPDDAAEYTDAYPPPGPFYGPPPPWWREVYAEYDMYGGPYGPPPQYRGPAREEPPADADETVSGQASAPQDTYYYYHGAPGGYWGWDAARRRVSRPPYDGPYGGYDPAAAPPWPPAAPPSPPPSPQSRGFAGERASSSLGRNPWAVLEKEPSVPLDPRAATASKEPPLPSPYPTNARGTVAAADAQVSEPVAQKVSLTPASEKELSDLAGVDASLAQLQAQIDKLQGGGAVTSATSAAAANAAALTTEPDEQGQGQGREGSVQGRRRPTTGGWRQQLLQEVEAQQPEEHQGRGPEGRGPEAAWEGSSGRLEEGRHQSAEPFTSSVSVSPAADREYERLLQMWRKAHPEQGNSRGEPYSESKKDDMPAAAGLGGEPSSERQQQQQQRGSQLLDVQGPQPTAAADDTLPQPPPEVKAADEADSSWKRRNEGPAPVAAAAAATQKPSGAESGSGPVGWFSRMFRGIAGGAGSGGTAQQAEQQQQQQPEAEEEEGEEQPQSQSNTELTPEVHLHREEQHRPQQNAELPGSEQARAQQQEQQQDKDGRKEQERRRPAEEVGAKEQAQASAALAAAVEAALQGQLAEQQPQPQPDQRGSQSVTAPASATASAVTAVPDRSTPAASVTTIQLRTAAAPARPSATMVPLPPSAAAVPSPKKESIQQLKATSAAAADRAAETLARIRAMRAATQAAGTRSGSGGRSYSGTHGNGNGSLAANLGKGTGIRGGNGSSAEHGSDVAAAHVAEDAARGGAPVADGAGGTQAVQSGMATGRVGPPRGPAEAH